MASIFVVIGGAISFVFQCVWWNFTAILYCWFMTMSAILSAIYICIKAVLWCIGETVALILILCARVVKVFAIVNARGISFSVVLVYVAIRCFLFIFIPLLFRGIIGTIGWLCEAIWVGVYSIGLTICVAVSILCFSLNAAVGGVCSVLTMQLTLTCEFIVGCFQFVVGLASGVIGWFCCVITHCVDSTCACLAMLGSPPPDSIDPIPKDPSPIPSVLDTLSLFKPLPTPSHTSLTSVQHTPSRTTEVPTPSHVSVIPTPSRTTTLVPTPSHATPLGTASHTSMLPTSGHTTPLPTPSHATPLRTPSRSIVSTKRQSPFLSKNPSKRSSLTASQVPGPIPEPPIPLPLPEVVTRCALPPPVQNASSFTCKAKPRLRGPHGSLSLDVVGTPPLLEACGGPPQRLVRSAHEQRCSRIDRQPLPPAEPKPLLPATQGPEYIKIRSVPKPTARRKPRRLRRACDWEMAHDCDTDCRRK